MNFIRYKLFQKNYNLNSQGGAITPHNHCIVENCRFINNTATKFYGGAISTEDEIDRSNANITIEIVILKAMALRLVVQYRQRAILLKY